MSLAEVEKNPGFPLATINNDNRDGGNNNRGAVAIVPLCARERRGNKGEVILSRITIEGRGLLLRKSPGNFPAGFGKKCSRIFCCYCFMEI